MSPDWRRRIIDADHPRRSIVRQCELVALSRSAFYDRPAGETELDLARMRLIDEQFLETPWYGARQMVRHLRRRGHAAGRVQRQPLRPAPTANLAGTIVSVGRWRGCWPLRAGTSGIFVSETRVPTCRADPSPTSK